MSDSGCRAGFPEIQNRYDLHANRDHPVWQFFSGQEYYEPRLPCDATRIGRFRRAIGEEGLELLLKSTIETAVEIKAIKPAELEPLHDQQAFGEWGAVITDLHEKYDHPGYRSAFRGTGINSRTAAESRHARL